MHKKEGEDELQKIAMFIKMANCPLPMLPGHNCNPSDVPDRMDDDYEVFGCKGSSHMEVEYLNYPQLPMAMAHICYRRGDPSQEPHSCPL